MNLSGDEDVFDIETVRAVYAVGNQLLYDTEDGRFVLVFSSADLDVSPPPWLDRELSPHDASLWFILQDLPPPAPLKPVPVPVCDPSQDLSSRLNPGWVPPPVESPPLDASDETTPKVLAAPTRPIVLGGPDDAPVVRGIEKEYLTRNQYQVVKVLFDAFPSRVAGDTLARKSGTEDPVGVIDRLSRDKDWASVLSKPGKAHGGYGIVSTPRKVQKNRETRPRKPRG